MHGLMHGLAMTKVCQVKGKLVSAAKTNDSVNCPFLHGKTWTEYDIRSYQRNGDIDGIVVPSDSLWVEKVVVKPHKYCKTIPSENSLDLSHATYLRGLTVHLTEAHGATNIGHAERDVLFLAHILRHRSDSMLVMPTNVYINDSLKHGCDFILSDNHGVSEQEKRTEQ